MDIKFVKRIFSILLGADNQVISVGFTLFSIQDLKTALEKRELLVLSEQQSDFGSYSNTR
jgi:hypothetical protein